MPVEENLLEREIEIFLPATKVKANVTTCKKANANWIMFENKKNIQLFHNNELVLIFLTCLIFLTKLSNCLGEQELNLNVSTVFDSLGLFADRKKSDRL